MLSMPALLDGYFIPCVACQQTPASHVKIASTSANSDQATVGHARIASQSKQLGYGLNELLRALRLGQHEV